MLTARCATCSISAVPDARFRRPASMPSSTPSAPASRAIAARSASPSRVACRWRSCCVAQARANVPWMCSRNCACGTRRTTPVSSSTCNWPTTPSRSSPAVASPRTSTTPDGRRSVRQRRDCWPPLGRALKRACDRGPARRASAGARRRQSRRASNRPVRCSRDSPLPRHFARDRSHLEKRGSLLLAYGERDSGVFSETQLAFLRQDCRPFARAAGVGAAAPDEGPEVGCDRRYSRARALLHRLSREEARSAHPAAAAPASPRRHGEKGHWRFL